MPTIRAIYNAIARKSVDKARMAVTQMSLKLARSDLSDEEAAEQLRAFVIGDLSAAQRSVQYLEQRRYTYDYDRAYRVACAASRNEPVQPPEPARMALFLEERELERMPLRDAFGRLAPLVPELDDMRRSVEADNSQYLAPYFIEIGKLMGRESRYYGELPGSGISVGIAMEYLRVLAGDTRRGDMNTPYSVIRERPMVTTLIEKSK